MIWCTYLICSLFFRKKNKNICLLYTYWDISTNHTSEGLEPLEGLEGTWCLMTNVSISSVIRVATKRNKLKQPPCCWWFSVEKLWPFCRIIQPLGCFQMIFSWELGKNFARSTRQIIFVEFIEACQVQLLVPGCSYCGAYFGWQHLKAQRKRLGHYFFFLRVHRV